MPKRKRTVSQDMGYGLGETSNQEKRRSMGLCPDQDMELELGEIREPENDVPMSLYTDHETQPFVELSQRDCKAEPEPFIPITQADCKADPEDPMEYQTTYGGTSLSYQYNNTGQRHIDYARYFPPRLHADVDLAMDNNYANDSLFLPSDSNMPHGVPGEAIDPADAAPSIPIKRTTITMPSGKTIQLTPWGRINAQTYYDDLTYNPKSTTYRFTTAAQLLDPKAFKKIGWSPEHYAGLTNTIPVPRSAYVPKPKPSASDPPRRTVYATNHNLAQMVGYMRRPITVMHQQGTGAVHPDFPTTWAAVALLTEAQLDGLAEFYHQTGRWNEWWLQYPCPLVWDKEGDGVWVKRRKMMEFIGIRRPERPPVEVVTWLNDLEEEAQRLHEEWVREEERREERRMKMRYWRGGRM
ncbi:hypothetical protein NKR19_g5592 [Coniochaeta hoffmannii]|uniref:Uncharacterized protein n=1 Tax=Coniochaeta hoffmannii TaxID=91930 RepID=A0AA38VSN8_9PEZI|nr:hypothetical protein NKR19_g5592 [Coniochaeta hoffmannii]